jgi:hypothetical protein
MLSRTLPLPPLVDCRTRRVNVVRTIIQWGTTAPAG